VFVLTALDFPGTFLGIEGFGRLWPFTLRSWYRERDWCFCLSVVNTYDRDNIGTTLHVLKHEFTILPHLGSYGRQAQTESLFRKHNRASFCEMMD
jgi:hypothetical protein